MVVKRPQEHLKQRLHFWKKVPFAEFNWQQHFKVAAWLLD